MYLLSGLSLLAADMVNFGKKMAQIYSNYVRSVHFYDYMINLPRTNVYL